MKKIVLLVSIFSLLLLVHATSQTLLQKENLQYMGAFKVPIGDASGARFSYGGTAPVYNDMDNTNPTSSCDCDPLPTSTNTTITVSTVAELQAAMQQANTNNGNRTILLEDGTYQLDNLLYIRPNMSNMTFRSVSGNRDAVIIRGQGMTGNVNNVFSVLASNVTIADMTIGWVTNHAIQVHAEENADNCLIQNVRLVDAHEQLLKVSGTTTDGSEGPTSDNGIIQCCLFEFTAGIANQWYTGGIDGHKTQNWIVRKNTFKHIRSPESLLAEHAIHFRNGAGGTIVENNLIINCDRGIGFGLGNDRHEGGIIRNNMVHTSRDVGIGLESASNAKVYNNTVITDNYSRSIEYRFAATTNAHIANNLTTASIATRNGGTGTIENNFTTTDKSIFVDADNYDFHLTAAQPQITNAGKILPEVSVDYDCENRLAAPDIGADEYETDGGNQEDCQVDRIHTNEVLTAGTYPTRDNIYSQAIIESAVTYKAGNAITLQAGFYARMGSVFSASIENCELSETITENLPATDYSYLTWKQATTAQQKIVVVPNPIESAATLYYELAAPSTLTIDLYDVNGKKVRNILSNTSVSSGKYQKAMDVSYLHKGMYIVVMRTENTVTIEKIIIQ